MAIIYLMAAQTLYAQKGEEEKKKEEITKKQEKEEQEMMKLLEEARKTRENIVIRSDELERAVRKSRENYATVKPETKAYTFRGSDPVVFIEGGSQSSSTLQFSKRVKEASFTKDLQFEIEEDARRASISVSGMCEEGEIRISISQPNNKMYTEVLIDEYGSINWTKSFNIKEDNGNKTGEWGFRIMAKNATGNFRLSLKSY